MAHSSREPTSYWTNKLFYCRLFWCYAAKSLCDRITGHNDFKTARIWQTVWLQASNPKSAMLRTVPALMVADGIAPAAVDMTHAAVLPAFETARRSNRH